MLGQIFIVGRRILGKPVNKKEPFTPAMLRLVVSKYGDKNDLSKLKVCVICLRVFRLFTL